MIAQPGPQPLETAPPLEATQPQDEQLVAAYVQFGDRNAIDSLIRRYSPRLRRMIISLIGRDDAAVLDAEQEVFVAMVQKLAQFKGEARFSTFFYRVARNKVVDLLRSRSRYNRRVMTFDDPDRAPGRMKGPEETLIDNERATLLRRAMESLQPEDQMMLYLKDGEGEPISELSIVTGLRAGTVKSRLARSRVKVKKVLEELGYE